MSFFVINMAWNVKLRGPHDIMKWTSYIAPGKPWLPTAGPLTSLLPASTSALLNLPYMLNILCKGILNWFPTLPIPYFHLVLVCITSTLYFPLSTWVLTSRVRISTWIQCWNGRIHLCPIHLCPMLKIHPCIGAYPRPKTSLLSLPI